MRLKISEIVQAVGGKLICGDENTGITGFSIDSREIKKGIMFVPIAGEKTDAHIYIDSVFENGAAATFTEKFTEQRAEPVVLVENCREALQRAAAYYRNTLDIPIVGVTGSAGKTSAKEIIAQTLGAKFHILKTAGNRNSQVGVPITVCSIKKEHSAAVIEMGISMPGEMERISAIVKPNLAVITNIGVSHIEYLKTRDKIMSEKLKIADYLPDTGVLIISGDDDMLAKVDKKKYNMITFGTGVNCDWRATDLKEMEKGTFFTVANKMKGERYEVFVPAFGVHNVKNAICAFAVARAAGVDAEGAIRAISKYKAPAMRQEFIKVAGMTIIDDSYNANPESMRASIDVLSAYGKKGRKIAILADMLELGNHSREEHGAIGKYAAERGLDVLIGIGGSSIYAVRAYEENGGKNGIACESNTEAYKKIKEISAPGDIILIKGSRGMKTEEIVKWIRG